MLYLCRIFEKKSLYCQSQVIGKAHCQAELHGKRCHKRNTILLTIPCTAPNIFVLNKSENHSKKWLLKCLHIVIQLYEIIYITTFWEKLRLICFKSHSHNVQYSTMSLLTSFYWQVSNDTSCLSLSAIVFSLDSQGHSPYRIYHYYYLCKFLIVC